MLHARAQRPWHATRRCQGVMWAPPLVAGGVHESACVTCTVTAVLQAQIFIDDHSFCALSCAARRSAG